MAKTNSISWPSMFDISRNRVAVKEDESSVTSRTRLLILSDPTELYNDLTFGVGLKRYLWQYNTPNTRAIIQDRIVEQLRQREPCVVADETKFLDNLLSTTGDPNVANLNKLEMSVIMTTSFGDEVSVYLNDDKLQAIIDKANGM